MKTRDETLADMRSTVAYAEARAAELGVPVPGWVEDLKAQLAPDFWALVAPSCKGHWKRRAVRDRLRKAGVSLEFDMIQRSRRSL